MSAKWTIIWNMNVKTWAGIRENVGVGIGIGFGVCYPRDKEVSRFSANNSCQEPRTLKGKVGLLEAQPIRGGSWP